MQHETSQLPSPQMLVARHPPGPRGQRAMLDARAAIRAALRGHDPRRVVIVGPCSLHDRVAALEYAARLAQVAACTADSLIVVMRTYFEKPRTIHGWKGFISDPLVDGSCDVALGLERARTLLVEIAELGVACASELLDPIVCQYLGDVLAWAAIGARTSESQVHREMASGLPMPIGFKNGTSGDVDAAVHGASAAARSHHYAGIDAHGRPAVIRTPGNPDAHVVLRGGRTRSNYSLADVSGAAERVPHLARSVLVDCSHDNSRGDPRAQLEVCRAVLDDDSRALLGVMLESHLEEGRQNWCPGNGNAYGVSITDACLGWKDTEALLHEMAGSKTRSVAGSSRHA